MPTDKLAELNEKILAGKVAEYDAIEGPRVGDWLRLPDGTYARLAEVNESFFQCGVGSFYLYGSASCDFSGSFHHATPPVSVLRQTGETRPGRIWFFSGNEARANNGVHFEIECRVFSLRDDIEGDDRERACFDDWAKWLNHMS